MRTQLTNELRNFNRTLVAFDMLISSDEEVALLVSKVQTDNALSTADILSERGKVYDDATRTGDVTKINKLETTTVKNLTAVVEAVERSNGGRGHTMKLLNGGYIVELSLIVNNKAKYENHIGEHEEILASMKVQEEKGEIKASSSDFGQGAADKPTVSGSMAVNQAQSTVASNDPRDSTGSSLITQLEAQVKEDYWPSTVQGFGDGPTENRIALTGWLAATKVRLGPLLKDIQTQHAEKKAVAALLGIIQRESSPDLSIHKAVCFKATGSLALLGDTSPDALSALIELQKHRDPVIAAQAQLHLTYWGKQDSAR